MAAPDDDLIERIAAAVAARLGGVPAPAPPTRRTLSNLLDRWSDAHSALDSFACDHARALFVLGWSPDDGPFAGIELGDRDPMSLTPEDVDAYRSWRSSTITRRKKAPTPATINREVMMVKRVLNFAASRRSIPHNPIEGIGDLDEKNIREVVIEEEGFAGIVAALAGDHQAIAFTTLAYDSGMREAEVLGCGWPWLEPERWRIHIPAVIAKNQTRRIADLSPRALDACRELPRHVRSPLIFHSDEGNEANVRWIYERFRRAVLASGVRGRNGEVPVFHDLRRSWITLARRRGIAESVIMAKSGHKDHAVFRRYSIVEESDLDAARITMEDGRSLELAALAERRRDPQRSPTVNADVIHRADSVGSEKNKRRS